MTTSFIAIRRLAAIVALAAGMAAPSASLAGDASATVRYGPTDGWTPYVVSLTRSANEARYGAMDGWYPYMVSLTARDERG